MSARSALRLRLRRVFYRKLIDRAEPGKKVGPGKGNRLNTKEARNAFDAHRHHKMVAMLANARSDADPQQIFATMQSEAIKAHQELDPELAKKIKIPKLVELPKPDPQEIAELQKEITQLRGSETLLRGMRSLRAFRRCTPSDYLVERLAQFCFRCAHRGLRQLHRPFPNNRAQQLRSFDCSGSAETSLLNPHRTAAVFLGDHSDAERQEGVR